MRRACLIVNPTSGTVGDDPVNVEQLPSIVSALQSGGITTDVVLTESGTSPKTLAQRALTQAYDLVIAAGGDGTVSEVAKGLLHTSMPLGILPIGTYNNIAHSLNLPLEIMDACQVVIHGQIVSIDVGVANNQHYFFEAAGVGLDAVLFPLGEEIKGGRWQRLWQVVTLTLNYQPKRIRMRFDRSIAEARYVADLTTHPTKRRLWQRLAAKRYELQRLALLVVIANGPYYGSGFTVAPDAALNDGLLTISVFRNFSKWELLRHFWSINLGQHHYNPKIETYRVAEVRLSARAKLPVHVDGQPIGELPVTMKAVKQALRVIVPTHPSTIASLTLN
ncbi:diacylglycerol/lipid kinase family protein [Thermocoleostomius sinensis]|uniref:Diacylglycerol kinase family lipid kinase n=1 Tax=Thermocoleostomius sinensis A174 TaxID=2016057 RepID=A0A9E9C5N1_9CYAN|nr:diacylglycerol kinase family protein [Thermocoleostomius sinensis]WAL58354.1 diacylglycerol kinase family lipid kinase [Thermocoleostomius sinensis A174]